MAAGEANSPPFPVVVMCHGLGGDKAGRGRASVLLSEELAKKGIASVRFDFRGNGDSEGSFGEQTPHRCVADLHSVMNWVKSQERLDVTHCGLYGRSFGGLIVLLYASQWQSCRALTVQAPPFTDGSFSHGVMEGRHPHLFYDSKTGNLLFEGEPLCPDFLRQMKAIDMKEVMEKLQSIPFFHISCGKDVIVDEHQTASYRECRTKAQATSRFFVLPEADHSCSRYCDRQTILKETTDWFISQLK